MAKQPVEETEEITVKSITSVNPKDNTEQARLREVFVKFFEENPAKADDEALKQDLINQIERASITE